MDLHGSCKDKGDPVLPVYMVVLCLGFAIHRASSPDSAKEVRILHFQQPRDLLPARPESHGSCMILVQVQIQCCFKSTETVGTIRDGEPRTSTSTFTQLLSSDAFDSVQCSVFKVRFKLQTLVYDILPSITAVFSYAIGSRKLSANEQCFVGAHS